MLRFYLSLLTVLFVFVFLLTSCYQGDSQVLEDSGAIVRQPEETSPAQVVKVDIQTVTHLSDAAPAARRNVQSNQPIDKDGSLQGALIPPVTPVTTVPVVQSYFDSLSTGNYLAAAQVYGGDYSQLIEYNPELPPTDYAALFEAACEVNGFICDLEISSILEVEQVSDLAVQYTLTLQYPDGVPFKLEYCCTSGLRKQLAQNEFVYTVAWRDGFFKVLELPIYAP